MDSDSSALAETMTNTDYEPSPALPGAADADQDSGSGSSSEDEERGGESGDSGESGAESSDGERPNDEENDWSDDSESSAASSEGIPAEEQITFPAVLPATSVRLMTQSVGCSMPDYVAAALGHLAMNKLRNIVMIANQLRKHHQCQGLTVDHFSMAEKLLHTQSFGHKSTYALPNFKPIWKGTSVLETSTPIDLHSTIQHSRKHPKRLQKITDVSLTHHQLHNTLISFNEDKNTNQEIGTQIDEAVASDSSEYFSSESSYLDSDEDQNPQHLPTQAKSKKRRKRSELLLSEPSWNPPNILPSIKIASKLESLMEKILVLNEEEVQDETRETSPRTLDSGEPKSTHSGVVAGIEWIDYVKVFMLSFFAHSSEIAAKTGKMGTMDARKLQSTSGVMQNGKAQDSPSAEKEEINASSESADSLHPIVYPEKMRTCARDFKLIIDDITSNGVFPVLNTLLNFFDDYMQGKLGDVNTERLQRILDVIRASLRCPAQIDAVYLQKIFKTLVTLMASPPPCELHQDIAHLLVLLKKKASRDFSVDVNLWTCEYVTETLNLCLISCLHSVQLNVTLFNLAVSLANSLEETGVHMLLELEWHNLVLEFVQGLKYLQHQEPERAEPMDTDPVPQQQENSSIGIPASSKPSWEEIMKPEIEETLMVFFRQFLKNYSEKLPSETIGRVQALILDTFGEKMVPYLDKPDLFAHGKERKTEIVVRSHQPPGKRIRSVQWKAKRITVGKIPKSC